MGYMGGKERKSYPSDMTDEQWEEIAPLYAVMRNCTWSRQELKEAILYLVDSGGKWRQLPHDFLPYSTVHSFYRHALSSGLWDKILEHLVKKTRINAGRKESPSYTSIDSQSVKTIVASGERGIDRGKNERQKAVHRSRCAGLLVVCCDSCCQYSWYKRWNIYR